MHLPKYLTPLASMFKRGVRMELFRMNSCADDCSLNVVRCLSRLTSVRYLTQHQKVIVYAAPALLDSLHDKAESHA